MEPQEFTRPSKDFVRIEKAIAYIESHFDDQPTLRDIAEQVNLSEYHFQRLFSRWVGISPKRFLQYLTKEYAKKLLKNSTNLLDTTYDSGLSSPGRLHDLFVACEAVTPGEYKSRGKGLTISYGFHDSPFGECLLAVTERGICGLDFVQAEGKGALLGELKSIWKRAYLEEAPEVTRPILSRIYNPSAWKKSGPVPVLLQGTNFQIKVWEALIRIPVGKVVTYEDVAVYIGMPKAVRAVGNAVGKNPVSFVIPCHRVIRKTADFGYYGGGPARKKAILGWEATLVNARI